MLRKTLYNTRNSSIIMLKLYTKDICPNFWSILCSWEGIRLITAHTGCDNGCKIRIILNAKRILLYTMCWVTVEKRRDFSRGGWSVLKIHSQRQNKEWIQKRNSTKVRYNMKSVIWMASILSGSVKRTTLRYRKCVPTPCKLTKT